MIQRLSKSWKQQKSTNGTGSKKVKTSLLRSGNVAPTENADEPKETLKENPTRENKQV